jgi:hypothetical protein
MRAGTPQRSFATMTQIQLAEWQTRVIATDVLPLTGPRQAGQAGVAGALPGR